MLSNINSEDGRKEGQLSHSVLEKRDISNVETSNESPPRKKVRAISPVMSPSMNSECSNSSWADVEPFMIGSVQMKPLNKEMKQRFILQYLTPMGDYQELLCHVFENNALSLILHYINTRENRDIRLAFESLKVTDIRPLLILTG